MITVRYFASARAVAGVGHEKVDASTMDTVRKVLEQRHGDRFARILAVSSVLIDGRAVDAEQDLPDGAVLEVLPPFAGG